MRARLPLPCRPRGSCAEQVREQRYDTAGVISSPPDALERVRTATQGTEELLLPLSSGNGEKLTPSVSVLCGGCVCSAHCACFLAALGVG